MARGITEIDVHTAADALVAAGERPTVERIRAHLGTGSPNTVIRWLDTWWGGLHQRLEVDRIRSEVPNLPRSVVTAAERLWEQALEAAGETQLAALARDRDQLQADRDDLEANRRALIVAEHAAQEEITAARQAQQLAEAQAAELQQWIAQLNSQTHDLTRQRDAQEAKTVIVEADLRAAQAELRDHWRQSEQERELQAERVKVLEDRAHHEIDLVRQELRESRKAFAAAGQERIKAEKSLLSEREQRTAAEAASSEIHREARARIEALERLLEGAPQARKRATGGAKKAAPRAIKHAKSP